MKQMFTALGSGLLFGLGLSISEMVNPEKVLGFLDLFGDWDPSLMFVMGAGVVVTLSSFRRILKKNRPFYNDRFWTNNLVEVDLNLIFGAIIFGIGWGLIGLCPGPAIASLAYGKIESVIFILSMFIGLYGDRLYRKLFK